MNKNEKWTILKIGQNWIEMKIGQNRKFKKIKKLAYFFTSILKSMSSMTFSIWAKIWALALNTFLTRPASLNNLAMAR